MGNVERLPVRSAERVAVLLNANARSVSETLKRELENFVPPEDLYYSRCFDDARSIVRQLLHEGKRAPFAGLGIDAKVLNDYVTIRDRIGPGGLGYFCSVVAKTLPSYMLQRGVPEVEVMNLGGPAQQIGADGKPIGRDIGAGEVIYRGPCKIAAAGTVPYYGFGFRVFPYALRAPGRFQLRLTAIGVPKILSNLRTLWRGGPPPSGIFDFHFDKVSLPFDPGMPLQGGGQAEGDRREVVFEMAERPLELLDFRASQPRAPEAA